MKKTVHLTISVDVEVDETEFTDEFLEEFDRTFCDLDQDINQHLAHLANLKAMGQALSFIEGYGKQEDMGIKLGQPELLDWDIYE